MEYILTSLEMFAGIAENLINYSFNVSNSSSSGKTVGILTFHSRSRLTRWMSLCGYFGYAHDEKCNLSFRRRLTIATIIFLPLTVLTGYFVRSYPCSHWHGFDAALNTPGNELCEHVVCSSKYGFLVTAHPSFSYILSNSRIYVASGRLLFLSWLLLFRSPWWSTWWSCGITCKRRLLLEKLWRWVW